MENHFLWDDSKYVIFPKINQWIPKIPVDSLLNKIWLADAKAHLTEEMHKTAVGFKVASKGRLVPTDNENIT